jgi:hypothetical protein
MDPLLGVFAKLRKAPISFVISACPSVRVDQLGSHWTEFCEILFEYFRKSVEKTQSSLKYDSNKGYFT